MDRRPYYALLLSIVNNKFTCDRAVRYMGLTDRLTKNKEKGLHKNARIVRRG